MDSKKLAVGVRELKNHLSAYLCGVKLGARILVLDHNEVVYDPTRARAEGYVDNPLVTPWIHQGIVAAPRGVKLPCPNPPLRAAAGTAARLLDEERGD